jgi:hypothetical protein
VDTNTCDNVNSILNELTFVNIRTILEHIIMIIIVIIPFFRLKIISTLSYIFLSFSVPGSFFTLLRYFTQN